MRQLVITSGKGGTGKTTVAAALIALNCRVVCADADVDAPNLHLLLHPEVIKERDFKGAKIAVKNEELCTGCGKCQNFCRFQAIQNMKIDSFRCEGCGVCVYVCPAGAIRLDEVVTGHVKISRTRYGHFSHALLNIGAEASGKLVTEVRKNAEEMVQNEPMIIIDGSPGIGCPVIASLSGTDMALIVSEPSLSGIHDLKRILDVTRHFGINSLVCINKFDLSPEMSREIESFCKEESIDLIGKIPFDRNIVNNARQEISVEKLLKTNAGKAIEDIWDKVKSFVFQEL